MRTRACAGGSASQGGLTFVEEPQLPLILFTKGFTAASEESIPEPRNLFAQDLNALGQFAPCVRQLGVLLPQLRVLTQERFDVPLHARRVAQHNDGGQ